MLRKGFLLVFSHLSEHFLGDVLWRKWREMGKESKKLLLPAILEDLKGVSEGELQP